MSSEIVIAILGSLGLLCLCFTFKMKFSYKETTNEHGKDKTLNLEINSKGEAKIKKKDS